MGAAASSPHPGTGKRKLEVAQLSEPEPRQSSDGWSPNPSAVRMGLLKALRKGSLRGQDARESRRHRALQISRMRELFCIYLLCPKRQSTPREIEKKYLVLVPKWSMDSIGCRRIAKSLLWLKSKLLPAAA